MAAFYMLTLGAEAAFSVMPSGVVPALMA